jgi:hypothetical protein
MREKVSASTGAEAMRMYAQRIAGVKDHKIEAFSVHQLVSKSTSQNYYCVMVIGKRNLCYSDPATCLL